jgi:26S proteasome regulatory subunit N12
MGDVAMTVRTVAARFEKLKAAYAAADDFACEEHLLALKKLFISFPTYLAPAASSPTKVQEVMLVREALEHGLLIAARKKDLDVFEGYYAQLQCYYHDLPVTADVPASERRLMIVGLNLMRLLVCSRIAEFHSELERVSYADHANLFVRMPVQLERYLMEGSYNKLLNARSQVPSNEYLPIVEMLENTVRLDIAECVPKTYPTLALAAARKMLMLPDDAATEAFAAKRGWELQGGAFVFKAADDAAARKEIPFKALLLDHIEFASQLQRVV